MIEDATRVALSDEDRAALSARLGVALHLIPTHRTVCPPCTFAIQIAPDGKGQSWRQDRSSGMKRIAFTRRMQALKARERAADEPQEVKRLVMVSGSIKKREPVKDGLAKQRPGSKPRVRKSRAKAFLPPKPANAPNIREDVELKYLGYLRQGMSRRAAGEAIGVASSGSVAFIIKKLKAAGYDVPDANEWRKGRERIRVVKP